MTDVSFDTLGTLDQLKQAGFEEAQARAITERLQKVTAIRLGETATKADVADLRIEIEAAEQRMSKENGEQFRWLAGIMIAGFSVVIAATRFL